MVISAVAFGVVVIEEEIILQVLQSNYQWTFREYIALPNADIWNTDVVVCIFVRDVENGFVIHKGLCLVMIFSFLK